MRCAGYYLTPCHLGFQALTNPSLAVSKPAQLLGHCANLLPPKILPTKTVAGILRLLLFAIPATVPANIPGNISAS